MIDTSANQDLNDLERILGGKIGRLDNKTIPGLNPVEGQNVIYHQDDRRATPKRLFKLLLEGVLERRAKHGGRLSDPCAILTPDGQLFRAMHYHGDLEGWRLDIEQGARDLGLLLAWFDEGVFRLSDRRTYSLTECVVTFD